MEPGLLAASLAMALLLMAFGALATLGGALLLRLLSGIRIMTAISQAAAATFFILLMPAGVCRLIARIRRWDPDPDPRDSEGSPYRSANFLFSATSFSSAAAGLNWSPMVAWNSFILASTLAGPTWSP